MKTVQQYLKECRDKASHNLYCYSANYGMTRPKDGMETAFKEAQRDVEIIEELLKIVDNKAVCCSIELDTTEANKKIEELTTKLENLGQIFDKIHKSIENDENTGYSCTKEEIAMALKHM